jgi:hypothetical protein
MSAPRLTVVGIPSTVGFEGFLSGVSDGSHTLTFRVYDVSTGGTALWTEALSSTQVTNGLYSVVLGATTAFTSSTFNGDRWIGVTVDSGSEITPRTRVSSVPFALHADNANKIGGGGTANMVALFDGACPSGWTEYTAGQGRVVVGLPSNGTLAGTVGTALTNLENRIHTHNYTDVPSHTHSFNWGEPGPPGYRPAGSIYHYQHTEWNLVEDVTSSHQLNLVYNTNPVATTGVATGTTQTASLSSVIPYIQLRYCKLNN